MPELPEVETIRRTLGPLVRGRRIADVTVREFRLRRPVSEGLADQLTGRCVQAARRRAKYLVFELDDGLSWIVHLGMSGRLLHIPEAEGYLPQKHDHVIVALSDGSGVVFNDPRRFGMMAVEDASTAEYLSRLGPEPLDPSAFAGEHLAALRRSTQRTIKDVLMDQHVVAGLGNIYVNEILFVSGIRPQRRLRRMTTAECCRVVAATRTILGEAIDHKGSSISDFLDGIGRRGGYQWRRRVYDRAGEACSACGQVIKTIVMAQRSSFYCPDCQR